MMGICKQPVGNGEAQLERDRLMVSARFGQVLELLERLNIMLGLQRFSR